MLRGLGQKSESKAEQLSSRRTLDQRNSVTSKTYLTKAKKINHTPIQNTNSKFQSTRSAVPSIQKARSQVQQQRPATSAKSFTSYQQTRGPVAANVSNTRSNKGPCTWRSPFSSFITQSRRRQGLNTGEFGYDLSEEEIKFNKKFAGPMKPLSQSDQELLKTGGRQTYLNSRYELSPDLKYNFPEATSWRIGWIHNERLRQETSK